MSYLKTVLTYHQPSEAEVDKAFLESHGFNVCLLNANTSRNELGAPFFIQLQVMEEDHARAVALLREANPARFGSPARVAEIERQIKRSVLAALAGALPAGIACYLLLPVPAPVPHLFAVEQPPDFRPAAAVLAAFAGGFIALRLARRRAPTAPSPTPPV